MTKLFLAAGVAALAITVPAVADPGKGGGKGGKAQSAQVHKGGGGKAPKAQKAREQRAERGKKAQEQRFERGKKAREQRSEFAKKAREQRFESQKRVAERRSKAAEKAMERREKLAEQRFERNDKAREKAFEAREKQLERLAERRRDAGDFRDRDWDDRVLVGRANGFVDGCPPGLAKKAIPCMPPGQAKAMVGKRVDEINRISGLRELPNRLQYIYPDTDDYYHRFGNGYVYRVDRETQLINSLLPLFGIGATVGQQFPSAYSNAYMPSPLQPFYPDTQSSSYRYANGYVYEIDPMTGLIEDVDPMLGYGYGYGQMMPLSYSAYNVPYQYRPLYADTQDHYYRYAPGAIYRVDSGSGLIDAVSALLTGGMTVGQQLPMGYDAYNVPLGYRDQYYDTPDTWYRYADNRIYQVDPTTRLVTAIVQALI